MQHHLCLQLNKGLLALHYVLELSFSVREEILLLDMQLLDLKLDPCNTFEVRQGFSSAVTTQPVPFKVL